MLNSSCLWPLGTLNNCVGRHNMIKQRQSVVEKHAWMKKEESEVKQYLLGFIVGDFWIRSW